MSMPGIQAEPVAVHGAAFNPWTVRRREDGEEEAAPYHEFVTFGEKHVKVWRRRASDGRWAGKFASLATLDEPRPGYERETSRTFVAHCAAFLPGGDVLGCGDGRLLAIDPETRRVRAESIRVAHAKPAGKPPSVRDERKREPKWGVAAMRVVNDGAEVVTAGADGRVLTWRVDERTGNDLDATPREEIALESPADGRSNRAPVIRALAVAGEPGPGRTEARTARTQTQKRQQTLRDAGECLRRSQREGDARFSGKAAPPLVHRAPSGGDFGGGGAAVAFGREPTAPDAGRFPRSRAPTPWALTDRGVEAEGPLEDGSEPKKSVGAQGSRTLRTRMRDRRRTRQNDGFFTSTRRRAACGASTATRHACSSAAPAPGGLCTRWREPRAPRRPAVGRRVRRGEGVDASRRSRLVARVLSPARRPRVSTGSSAAPSPSLRTGASRSAPPAAASSSSTRTRGRRARRPGAAAPRAHRLESVPAPRDALAFSRTRPASPGGATASCALRQRRRVRAGRAVRGHSATVTALDWMSRGGAPELRERQLCIGERSEGSSGCSGDGRAGAARRGRRTPRARASRRWGCGEGGEGRRGS